MATARVVYLAGWGRSGSTVLCAMLGRLPGAFAAGELRSYWARGVLDGRLCGCGVPVPECPVWSQVGARMAGVEPGPEVIRELQARRLRSRDYPIMWLREVARRRPAEVDAYLDAYTALYRATQAVTGAEVLIDSSKYPLELFGLAERDLDLKVVHLVRDPRAVAHSWGRPRSMRDSAANELFRPMKPFASSLIWTSWNLMIGRFPAARGLAVLTIRYEDLVADADGVLREIAAFTGMPAAEAAAGELDHDNHMVAGNPSRFGTGRIELKLDDEWIRAQSRRARIEATLPALPLLHRFRYPFAPKATSPT